MTCPAQTVMRPEEMWILGRTPGGIETVMILSIYTQKMFVSSPLKDDGLEDAPFLLRDSSKLLIEPAGRGLGFFRSHVFTLISS